MRAMKIEKLDRHRIEEAFEPGVAAALSIEILSSVDSTNAELLRRASAGSVDGVVIMAEQQTAGRGRSGRRWSSPPSGNLYLSLGWHYPGEVADLAGLSLAVGVVVAEAVSQCCGVELLLKWPNDVVHPQGKVGGILIETAGSGADGVAVIIGIGLNLAMSDEGAKLIDQPWIDIAALSGNTVARNHLAGELAQSLWHLCSHWAGGGFASWRSAWQQRDALRGRMVTLDGSEPLSGIASGVAIDGGLLVDTGARIATVYSGEARLRKSESLNG
jgi:BirA family biotin operon repressor/biotin-[acetyl-CoA-carboxylase] ligase